MANLKIAPYLYDDAVIPVSASGLTLINIGDWVIWSAQWAIAAHDATIGSPAYKQSAAGVALEPNPTVDGQGAWINNTGMVVARRGVFRVSAGNSGTARTIPIGSHAYPDTTGSGINGHTGGTTGATGLAATWLTAPVQQISGNPTGAVASGVAVVINHPLGGDSGAGQLDVAVNIVPQPYW